MANKVLLKKSSTAAKVPVVGDLDYGELALNYTDGKLYYKTASNTIDSIPSISATATLTNKTLSSPTITGTLTAGGGAGTSGQYLQSTGTGVQWASVSGGTSISQGNSSVAVVDAGTGTITTTVDGTVVQTDTVSGSAFSGIPTAPTAAANTSTTQVATTAFAVTEALNKAVAMAIALG